jgi:hypothetical protein
MFTNFVFFFLTKCSLTLLILDIVLYSFFFASVTKPLTPEGTKKIRRKGFLQKLEYLVNMTQWHVIWVHFVSKMITNVRRLVLVFTAVLFFTSWKWCDLWVLSLPAEENFVLPKTSETTDRSVYFYWSACLL